MKKLFCILLLVSSAQAEDIDVFLIAGQSNAVGFGVAAQGPTVPHGKCLSYFQGTVTNANDPVGNAQSGSAWPSFCLTYYRATQHCVMVVPAAVGATGQSVKADTGYGNWDNSGSLVPRALGLLDEALAAATNAGWTPIYRGVLWCQGESDANAINAGKENASDYRNALIRMIDRFRVSYPESYFYVFRTGQLQAAPNGYTAVRSIQEEVCRTHGYGKHCRIVYRGAYYYPLYGLMGAGAHYSQPGYNMMGHYGAHAVINDGILSNWIILEGPVRGEIEAK